MNKRSYALAGAFAAAFGLAACGGDEEDTADIEPVVEDAGPAMEAEPPLLDAEPPAIAAEPPAIEAAAGGMEVALRDLTGLWAQTPERCETDPVTITADIFALGELSCIVTGVDDVEGGMAVGLLCLVADAEPQVETWTVNPIGEAPHTQISITMGEAVAELTRCP